MPRDCSQAFTWEASHAKRCGVISMYLGKAPRRAHAIRALRLGRRDLGRFRLKTERVSDVLKRRVVACVMGVISHALALVCGAFIPAIDRAGIMCEKSSVPHRTHKPHRKRKANTVKGYRRALLVTTLGKISERRSCKISSFFSFYAVCAFKSSFSI